MPLSKDYLVIVCLSYLFTGISYMLANALRSVGSAYLPMLVSLFAVLTNTGLNYLLIFGKGGFPVFELLFIARHGRLVLRALRL